MTEYNNGQPKEKNELSSLPLSDNKSLPEVQPMQKEIPTECKWSKRENKMLRKAIWQYKDDGFEKIAEQIPGKTKDQCKQRYKHIREKRRIKKIWTSEEEATLQKYLSECPQEDPKNIDNISESVSRLLKNKSMRKIKKKIKELQNKSKIKKVVIRNR